MNEIKRDVYRKIERSIGQETYRIVFGSVFEYEFTPSSGYFATFPLIHGQLGCLYGMISFMGRAIRNGEDY